MNEKTISIKTNAENRIFTALNVLNGILNLTKKELLVVYNFLLLNAEYPCNKEDRKMVREKMKLKNVQTLNNIILAITKKKVFIRTGNGYQYSPLVQNLDKVSKITVHVQDV